VAGGWGGREGKRDCFPTTLCKLASNSVDQVSEACRALREAVVTFGLGEAFAV